MVALVFRGRDHNFVVFYAQFDRTSSPHPCEMNTRLQTCRNCPQRPYGGTPLPCFTTRFLERLSLLRLTFCWLFLDPLNPLTNLPSLTRFISWIVIPVAFFGIFGGERAKLWGCKHGESSWYQTQGNH